MRSVYLFLFISFFSFLFISGCASYDDFISGLSNSTNLSSNLINNPFEGEYNVVREFDIEMSNFIFSKKILNVEYGEKVRIKLINVDGFHSFVIEELGVSSDILATGEVDYLEFIVTKRGKFKFYSSYGDDAMKVMDGMLYVE
jgi:heme/copper-type cytochrome/quinol oxidase subunit 2